ncbi:disease resistance protein TAO1 [Cryptomeria japonica]|uniref:disease resistance protein TAO1 n=1 Tax=Cryptomeria japonica TaxID=3369 RepID=UPI0027DA98A1|nr:disease resistance protein TAO1 [Cryptomeria japonica]
MVKTSRGIWSLAPSRLGLKLIVAQGCNLNFLINEATRDLIWLRWLDIGQRNLLSLILLKKLRVLEFFENWRLGNHIWELWVADCDAPLQLRVSIISYCHQFDGLPKSIGSLKQLRKIVLQSAPCLESLPQELCLLHGLLSLPYSMGNLRNLRHLSLWRCEKLGRLPDSCKELTLLQHLNLRVYFNVTFMLDIMENMSKLEFLDFAGCKKLKELPRHITNQASLRDLDINTDGLREVPTKICQLSKLQKMCVRGDSLTSLPTSLRDLSSLKTLKIAFGHRLECLRDYLRHLCLLERLDIKILGVKFLPKSISELINLESLLISHCEILELNLGTRSLSSSLCKLKTIHLSDNDKLSMITISKDSCTSLETLTVENHRNLKEIVGLLGSIRKQFIIECPKLSALPSFAQLTSLQEFGPRGC